MRKKNAVSTSYFHCNNCNSTTPLPRYYSREKYHIKDLWCYKCKEVTKHTEERERDFILDKGENINETS